MKLPGSIRFVVGMLLAAGLVEGGLYLGVPALVHAMVPGIAKTEIGRKVSVGDVSFNPFKLTLGLGDLRLFSADGQSVEVAIKRIDVDVSSASLRKTAPVVESLSIEGLQIALGRDAQGRLNIDDILERLAEKPPSPEPARYAFNNVRLSNASFAWKDETTGQKLSVTDIDLDLPFLSSLPGDVKIAVQPRLRATVETGELTLRAQATPFDETRTARLSIALEKFPLPLVQPWLPKTAGVSVLAGQLHTTVDLDFSESAEDQRALSVSAKLGLEGFLARMKSVLPAASQKTDGFAGERSAQFGSSDLEMDVPLASMELQNVELLAPLGRQPALGPLTLSADVKGYGRLSAQGQVSVAHRVWKGSAGIEGVPLLSLVKFMPPAQVSLVDGTGSANALAECQPATAATAVAAGTAGGVTSAQAAAVACTVSKASLNIKGLKLKEQSGAGGAEPVLWQVPSLLASVRNFKPGSSDPVAFTLDVSLPDAPGALHADGQAVLSPVAVESVVRVNKFPLALLQPYMDAYTSARLTRGTLDLDTRIAWKQNALDLDGKAALAALRLAPADKARSVLRLDNFAVNGIQAQADLTGLKRLNINGVKIEGLDARIERDSAGRLNWEQLLVAQKAGGAGRPTAQAAEPSADKAKQGAGSKPSASSSDTSPVIEVGVVQLERTNVSFTDAAVQPPFDAKLTNLKGQMSAFSTLGPRRSTLELTGSLDGDGLLVISGQFDPVKPRDYLNISLRARGIEMTRLSPYSARYAGYNIAKGKLSTTLNYRVENGALVADNSLFLDQLNFGDAVESPDATTLPVRLAVALLKNLKGEIDLNLPVKGSLNDPQFSIGEVVFKALGNIIVKAVSAPFRLVASLFDSDEEFAGTLEFDAGVAQVPDSARKQLNGLVATLTEKPDLELEITGYADLLTDSAGLQQVRKRETAINPDDIRRLAYERAVAAKNAIVAIKPELAERLFLVAPNREQLGKQAEKPRRAVDFALR